MKILLINPNRYRTPPVPPLALEYLAGALDGSPHGCRILDLCFAEDPVGELDREINAFKPNIAGFTIRNIDTVIYHNNVFFLDDIKSLVSHVRGKGIPVVLGGAGFSFVPEGILGYAGAEWGVYGPGERALPAFLDRYEQGDIPRGTILDGWEYGIDTSHRRRHDAVDYGRYFGNRGLAGFETQKGCFGACSYCPEGNRHVMFKNPSGVVEEISELTARGITSFHLCDTEFNQDLAHCKAFLEALIASNTGITWVLYMKTSPYDDDLFRLLRKSGAQLVTLSVPTGDDSLDHAETVCRLARKYGLRLAVDFLCGFPGETAETVRAALEKLRRMAPDTVGVNSYFRLIPKLAVTRQILSSPGHRRYLLGEVENNPDMIRPVFYNSITVDMLKELVGNDPLFKIEGFERTSNYERLQG